MTTLPHPNFAAIRDIVWDDTSSILDNSAPMFGSVLTERGLLDRLLDGVRADAHLAALCERYDFLDKLVVYDDPESSVRLRLHLYRPGYFDRPHNHRWAFSSMIVSGSYRHLVYGDDERFDQQTDPESLRAVYERVERPGSHYALHHTSVHAVQAEADTISLLLRGPATSDRFLILDREAGGSFWVYGAARESAEQRASKRMSATDIDQTVARVREVLGAGSSALIS